ncbi:MAG: hypothetical protein COV30_00050 [Candidatus Yanofskybacteria bacterium CG10_big_fil_rev_8_21_14_0_10_37_15]|uniref:Uncharacterized protein n=1 Tax=Candidatus Yanofskybacteria bacterium CG10_big_fil_rev_8_21_14_0_10_37_15 TaxID=1975097 RepID=A0A2H0R6J3_9BACT|nr:MAG: hypothetical protein COV30_00050 [Candidatus Yanofskybacteria bacterium CG10_big_fil_rev_8_21_14_0_10_37_15]
MKKFYILVGVFVGVMTSALFVYALEENTSTRRIPDVGNVIKRQADSIRGKINEIRANFKTETTDERQELKTDTRNLRENLKTPRMELEQKREEFLEKIRIERDGLKDKIMEKREDLKDRLNKIKNQRKREIVERIDKSMDELNERMVNHFTQVLDKIEDVLKRAGEKVDMANERGVDVSSIEPLINEAIKAIGQAREAVSFQAGKTYTIEIVDEEGLKNKVGEARQSLRNDLKVVQDTIKNAHEAVRNIIIALSRIQNPTPTSLPQASPSVSVEPDLSQ